MKKINNSSFLSRVKRLLDEDFTRQPSSEDGNDELKRRILITKWWDRLYKVVSVITTLIFISVLLLVVINSPEYGDPNNPTMNEVAERYVEKGTEETGATNTVAGMILDYRAFDTFGEAIMMFASAMGVVGLLRITKDEEGVENENN